MMFKPAPISLRHISNANTSEASRKGVQPTAKAKPKVVAEDINIKTSKAGSASTKPVSNLALRNAKTVKPKNAQPTAKSNHIDTTHKITEDRATDRLKTNVKNSTSTSKVPVRAEPKKETHLRSSSFNVNKKVINKDYSNRKIAFFIKPKESEDKAEKSCFPKKKNENLNKNAMAQSQNHTSESALNSSTTRKDEQIKKRNLGEASITKKSAQLRTRSVDAKQNSYKKMQPNNGCKFVTNVPRASASSTSGKKLKFENSSSENFKEILISNDVNTQDGKCGLSGDDFEVPLHREIVEQIQSRNSRLRPDKSEIDEYKSCTIHDLNESIVSRNEKAVLNAPLKCNGYIEVPSETLVTGDADNAGTITSDRYAALPLREVSSPKVHQTSQRTPVTGRTKMQYKDASFVSTPNTPILKQDKASENRCWGHVRKEILNSPQTKNVIPEKHSSNHTFPLPQIPNVRLAECYKYTNNASESNHIIAPNPYRCAPNAYKNTHRAYINIPDLHASRLNTSRSTAHAEAVTNAQNDRICASDAYANTAAARTSTANACGSAQNSRKHGTISNMSSIPKLKTCLSTDEHEVEIFKNKFSDCIKRAESPGGNQRGNVDKPENAAESCTGAELHIEDRGFMESSPRDVRSKIQPPRIQVSSHAHVIPKTESIAEGVNEKLEFLKEKFLREILESKRKKSHHIDLKKRKSKNKCDTTEPKQNSQACAKNGQCEETVQETNRHYWIESPINDTETFDSTSDSEILEGSEQNKYAISVDGTNDEHFSNYVTPIFSRIPRFIQSSPSLSLQMPNAHSGSHLRSGSAEERQSPFSVEMKSDYMDGMVLTKEMFDASRSQSGKHYLVKENLVPVRSSPANERLPEMYGTEQSDGLRQNGKRQMEYSETSASNLSTTDGLSSFNAENICTANVKPNVFKHVDNFFKPIRFVSRNTDQCDNGIAEDSWKDDKCTEEQLFFGEGFVNKLNKDAFQTTTPQSRLKRMKTAQGLKRDVRLKYCKLALLPLLLFIGILLLFKFL